MKRMTVSQSELAAICGVSQGTVDRALNGRQDIKAETRERILRAAKEYGYREEIRGKDELRGQVGIIVFNLNNEYFTDLITETEAALRRQGYGASVMMTHYDKQSEIECIRNMYNMGVCGIILCPVNGDTEFRNYLRLFDIPIVTVGNNICGVPYIGVDDSLAMSDMTEYVLSSGFERLMYFSPALTYTDAYAQRARYEGFLRTVGSRDFTLVTDIADICEVYDGGTAIIASTDYYAIKAYLKSKGTRIFGFDNIATIDKFGFKISSVGYSIPQIAASAVDTVLGSRPYESLTVPHEIVTR